MRFTNKHGLPEAMYRALTNDPYTKGDADFSVTELEQPPLLRWLMRRHFDEVEIDASSRLWSMLGQSVHSVIERAGPENDLTEERLTMTLDGKVISGAVDNYSMEHGGTVRDWKVQSYFAYADGPKPEWIGQGNGYGALFREHGFPVKRLENWVILRDWSRARFKENPSEYPAIPFMRVVLPIWDHVKALRHMSERLGIHLDADEQNDQQNVPLCTPQERWAQEPTFACQKEGNKRATKVFKPSRDCGGKSPEHIERAKVMAQEFADSKGIDMIERPGEETRCLHYCPVKEFCRFGQKVG